MTHTRVSAENLPRNIHNPLSYNQNLKILWVIDTNGLNSVHNIVMIIMMWFIRWYCVKVK